MSLFSCSLLLPFITCCSHPRSNPLCSIFSLTVFSIRSTQVVVPDPTFFLSHASVQVLVLIFSCLLLLALSFALLNWCRYPLAKPMPLLSICLSWGDVAMDLYFAAWLYLSYDHCSLPELLPFLVVWAAASLASLLLNLAGVLWLMRRERKVFGPIWGKHKLATGFLFLLALPSPANLCLVEANLCHRCFNSQLSERFQRELNRVCLVGLFVEELPQLCTTCVMYYQFSAFSPSMLVSTGLNCLILVFFFVRRSMPQALERVKQLCMGIFGSLSSSKTFWEGSAASRSSSMLVSKPGKRSKRATEIGALRRKLLEL